jgi:hypothetical protein
VNASYARTPIQRTRAESFVESVMRLDDLADTSTLMKELHA